MELNLRGRAALVAGSSRGIGMATASSLLAEGCCVTISGRTEADVVAAADRLRGQIDDPDRVLPVVADLGDRDAVRGAVDATVTAFGSLDVAVANVGAGTGRPGWSQGDDAWQQALSENLWPAVLLAEEALPQLGRNGAGCLVFVGSIAGAERMGPLPYGTAKAAVSAYASRLAAEVAADGVRVVCVAPGNVLVEGGNWERKLAADPAGTQELLHREVPLGRFAAPAEIADVITFVASPRAAFLTGTTVVVDGGQTRG